MSSATLAFELASALLRYPDNDLIEALSEVRNEIENLPSAHRPALTEFTNWLENTPLGVVQQEYCETFDFDRRSSLYLTWHQYGDRRQRGIVLLQLRRAYKEAGCQPVEDELPDWLPMMLEFAASSDSTAGTELLETWRASIELIRQNLHEHNRRWACVLDLVSAHLSRLGGDIRSQIKRLLDEGPPNEEVGLEPFAQMPDTEPRWDAQEITL